MHTRIEKVMEDFETTAKKFLPLIKKYAWQYAYAEDIDDLVQIGLITLWQLYETYGDQECFPKYVKKRVQWRMLNYVNQNKSDNCSFTNAMAEVLPAIHEKKWSRQTWEMLAKHLTEKQRAWFIGYYVEGKSLKIIAEEMNTTVSAVKQWRITALQNLKNSHHFSK